MRRKIKIFREWLDKGKLAAEGHFSVLPVVEGARAAVQQL